MAPGDEPTIRDLADAVARQASTMDAWESAELHVLEIVLRERLCTLRIGLTPDMGAVLMAVAQLLAERAPEWGGDARDTLAEVAVLGLRLLDGEPDEGS